MPRIVLICIISFHDFMNDFSSFTDYEKFNNLLKVTKSKFKPRLWVPKYFKEVGFLKMRIQMQSKK